MRRNQIISDVFLQLNFMEQRGSGIDRILNSYAEVAQNPVFYSDSDIFLVTLLNWMEMIESPQVWSLPVRQDKNWIQCFRPARYGACPEGEQR